jgi:hypothetical protein
VDSAVGRQRRPLRFVFIVDMASSLSDAMIKEKTKGQTP